MKGWFEVARISCSASARLILLRLIISFLERTGGLAIDPDVTEVWRQ